MKNSDIEAIGSCRLTTTLMENSEIEALDRCGLKLKHNIGMLNLAYTKTSPPILIPYYGTNNP